MIETMDDKKMVLIFPINCRQLQYWFLIHVDLEQLIINMYDSCGKGNEKILFLMKKFLKFVSKERTTVYQYQFKTENSCDCGLFVCIFVTNVLNNIQ